MKLRAGVNIVILEDGGELFISAPLINRTVLKNSAFTLSAECIEFIAGEHIRFATTGKDKLTITADIDKEKLRILELEKRVTNLEKVIVSLITPKAEVVDDNQS